jgi:D-alanyl-D-alanine carboxypeptidase (penicillin-binding protein 5/6)
MSLSLRGVLRLAFGATFVAAVSAAAFPASAQIFETKAPYAILVDVETDTVLFQKDADRQVPPASLAKLMTAAVLFEALKVGRLKPETEFEVSENAWRKGGAVSGGSTMFAKVHSAIPIADLMRGLVIQSGNDAAIAIAEGMAGTEEAFADQMNLEARKVGLANSKFRNSTGLPDPEQKVTARDLAKLGAYIIRNFPEQYRIYGEPDFLWNKIRQRNRNPLLTMNIGADGMKTGYLEESGYGLVGSAIRDGQRLIVVVLGTQSERERSEEARKLLEWGFRAFHKVTVFDANDVIAEARVYGGDEGSVPLVSKKAIEVMLPTDSLAKVAVKVAYTGPLPAPVKEGQPVGTLRISIGDDVTSETPLFAAAAVEKGSIRGRAGDAIKELLLGWW